MLSSYWLIENEISSLIGWKKVARGPTRAVLGGHIALNKIGQKGVENRQITLSLSMLKVFKVNLEIKEKFAFHGVKNIFKAKKKDNFEI